NRSLAAAAAKWRTARGFKGNLVLPLILVHVEQVHFKPRRATIVKQAEGRRARATAEGIWIVNSGLDDQSGSRTNGKTFPGLVSLHEECRAVAPDSTFIVAGPY